MITYNKGILIGIPCYNEESTIKKVVEDFKRELPEAKILVVDNNSSDNTAKKAREAGAEVEREKRQGKGFAVQKIFEKFTQGYLVIVDGDDTYSPEEAHKLIDSLIQDKADMLAGNRLNKKNKKSFSTPHWWGNKMFAFFINLLFKTNLNDILSGYRVFNQNFKRNAILLSGGFEIESELTIQSIERNLKIKELPVSLKKRGGLSTSKIRTFKDGFIILYTISSLFRDYKPLEFFSVISFFSLAVGMFISWRGISEYLETGLVTHLPSLVVGGFLVLFSFISFIAGLILSSLKRRHEEIISLIKKNNF
ncbi:MAG: glycosyltransferase [Candidatus Moranbacteria bacterium]|nr:glycosyltransferase [Candidatus Moranbacteria bacterium]